MPYIQNILSLLIEALLIVCLSKTPNHADKDNNQHFIARYMYVQSYRRR